MAAPPLPPGFKLDPPTAAPPLPPGFTLDAAPAANAAPAQQQADAEFNSRDPYAYFDPRFRQAHGIANDPTADAIGRGAGEILTGLREDPAKVAQAGAAGFNKGVVTLLASPADIPADLADLIGAGYGTGASLLTGRPAGEFYTPIERGSGGVSSTGYGDALANQLDRATSAVGAGTVTKNPIPGNPAGRLLYAAGQAVPGAMTGRQAAAAAAGGAASDIVAEAGGGPAAQAAASLIGNRVGEIRTPRETVLTRREGAPAVTDPGAQPAARTPPSEPGTGTTAPLELTASGPARAPSYTDLEGSAVSRKAPRFVEATPVADNGAKLGLGDQARRKDILRRVGVGELRNSAVQGDAKAAATDFQMSKLDSPDGQHMARVLGAEHEAIANYADKLAEDTGGTRGTSQTENQQRGQNIVAPLDGIKDFYDTRTADLYKLADQRAKDRPFDTAKVRKIVGDDSEFLGTIEGEALLRGTKARMKALGMTSPDGVPQRTTVAQAERLKQYLGNQWTPRTSRLIKSLKDAIDDDVFSAAGEDVYKRARQMRAERARILDDPQGIAKVMDAGPQGINRAVATERVGDVVSTLPVAQFAHIVKTLNEAPAELRGPAQSALAEIKSQFASKVAEIGNKTSTQWNAKGVSKYLNDNSARLRVVFSPAELQRFADLNDAGHILRFDSSYPGAAVQSANLKRAAVLEHGLTAAGGAVGAMIGGPLGGAAGVGLGKMAGAKASRRMNDRASLKAAQARTTDLRSEPGNALARP